MTVWVWPASHTAPSSTPTTLSGPTILPPLGLKQATTMVPRAELPLQRRRVLPVSEASFIPIFCRIHPRKLNTSVNVASPVGVLQSLTVPCEAIPRTVARPYSTVTNPEPLSPSHNDALAAAAVM